MTSAWKIKQPTPQRLIISAKVTPATKDKLEDVAKRHGLSVSRIAAQCIEQALTELEN